ncbi:hypothetical protein NC651_014582 [Populus alba x Populus x berolinensis]|nr:hypothetical protein NC651_014582 [Populus alba x Populus x berolinensis]
MNLIYLESYFITTTYWADSLPLNLPLNLFTLLLFPSLHKVMRMRCFSCIKPNRNDMIDTEHAPRSSSRCSYGSSGTQNARFNVNEHGKNQSPEDGARSFTFLELAAATRNFREVNLIGEGGFGKVYKGRLETGELVAVKQLNQDGLQGDQEFIVEVLMLSLLHHSNLVTLTGYCTSGDQRLLVYEYMPMGSLEDHLFAISLSESLIIIVCDAGCALDASSIPIQSQPFLKDQKKYCQLADPLLEGCYPRRCFNYAIAITAMCLNEQASFRPLIGDILAALEYLAAQCHVSESNTGRVRGTNPSPPYSDRKVVSPERDSRSVLPGLEGMAVVFHTIADDIRNLCIDMGNCWGSTPVTNHNSPSATKPSTPKTSANHSKENGPGGRSSSDRKEKESDVRIGMYVENKDKDGTARTPPSGQVMAVLGPKLFTLAELKIATRNFRPDTVLGEGGFGRVFKGWVDEKTFAPAKVGCGMAVAVKKSKPDSSQGLQEWQAFNAKLSDFGLAKFGPLNGNTHVTTRVMGTYGYAAPEYVATAGLILQCLESDPRSRPSMEEVLETLKKIDDTKDVSKDSKGSAKKKAVKRQEEHCRHQPPLQSRHGGAGNKGRAHSSAHVGPYQSTGARRPLYFPNHL